MATKIVLVYRHMRSLQLLYTVGGNQARSDARSEFKILERSPKGGVKLVVPKAVRPPRSYSSRQFAANRNNQPKKKIPDACTVYKDTKYSVGWWLKELTPNHTKAI
jgi:hypothetical protein